MPKYQFCEDCIDQVQESWDRGEDFEEPALACNDVMMHDGVRLAVRHLCDRHSGATIECGVRNWGLELSDEAIAYPLYLN